MSEVFDKAVKEGLASLGEINPLDYVEHPSQIPEFIKSFRKKERTSQINPEGLTATEQMHRRFPSIDPSIKHKERTGIFPHPKRSFKEGFDLTDWQNSQLGIEFLKLLSHEGGKYPYEAGAKDPEGIQAIETFKGVMGPTGSLLLPSLTKAALKGATDPTVMRMFVGEEAKLPKQTMKDLDRAKRLDENGRDRDYIYDQTGWFQDPQSKNKWKFEISDAEARIKQNVDLTKPNLTLGDVLHHPELYKAHPEFKKHPVTKADKEGAISTAHYSHETGEIYVKPFLDKTIRTRLEKMDELLNPIHIKTKPLSIAATKKNKIQMRELLERFGYRTKKEVEKITDKQLENIIQKEVIKDYNKLKKSVPMYLTNTDWLINQRKLGAVPNTKQYNRLLKNEDPNELTEIRGTRGIWEPDYIHIPKEPKGRMWSEQATSDLTYELRHGQGFGGYDKRKGTIQEEIRKGFARNYRKKPGTDDDFRFPEQGENIRHTYNKTSEQIRDDEILYEKLLNELTEQFQREPVDKGYFEAAVRDAAATDRYRIASTEDVAHGLFPDPDSKAFNKLVRELEPLFIKSKSRRRDGELPFDRIREKFGDEIADDIEDGFKYFAETVAEDVPFKQWKDTSGFGHRVVGNDYLGYKYYPPGSSKQSSQALDVQDAMDNARRWATNAQGRRKGTEQGKVRDDPAQYISMASGKPKLAYDKLGTGTQWFPEPPTYITKGYPLSGVYGPSYKTKSLESLGSFLHEAQHGMQQRSGFSPGTSWTSKLGWPDQLKYIKKDLKRIGAEVETEKQPGLFMMEEAIPDTKLRNKPFPEWMTDEFFHYPVSINYKGKKYSIEEGKESWPSELANHLPSSDYHALREMNKLGKKREAYWEYHHSKGIWPDKNPPKGSEAPEFYLKGHEGRKAMSGKEQYLTKAGEAEARNVERRRDLPAQTFPRKDKDVPRPWETLDVKEEMLWTADPYSRMPYPFMPKKKTGGGLVSLGEGGLIRLASGGGYGKMTSPLLLQDQDLVTKGLAPWHPSPEEIEKGMKKQKKRYSKIKNKRENIISLLKKMAPKDTHHPEAYKDIPTKKLIERGKKLLSIEILKRKIEEEKLRSKKRLTPEAKTGGLVGLK